MAKRLLERRETDTVIAALRYWQREGLMSAGHEIELAEEHGPALDAVDIDHLVEEMNREGVRI